MSVVFDSIQFYLSFLISIAILALENFLLKLLAFLLRILLKNQQNAKQVKKKSCLKIFWI